MKNGQADTWSLERTIYILAALVLTLPMLSSCENTDGVNLCGDTSVTQIESGICIVFESDLYDDWQADIIDETTAAVGATSEAMPINDLAIRYVHGEGLAIPEIGIGGYNPNGREVLMEIDVSSSAVEENISDHLGPILVHELHHLVRRREVGYGSTLLEAVISEGLADHFSIEIFAIDPPPWSVALQDEALDSWIEEASKTWDSPGYDHWAWFAGTRAEIPRWAGYSIGFELVQRYLNEHPERKPSDLVDEPASSFRR